MEGERVEHGPAAPARASSRRERALAGLLLLIPTAVIAYAFWPGTMTSDSLAEYEEAHFGVFSNQHSALFNWLWSLVLPHGVGPGFVLVASVVVFTLGCFLLLSPSLGPLWAAVATVLVCAFPPLFGLLGYLGRDVWFTGLLLLSLGAIGHAILAAGARRAAWVVLGLAAAWMALASRQNALPAVLVPTAVLAWLAFRHRAWFRGRLRPLLAVAGGGAALLLVLVASQSLLKRAIGVTDVRPEQYALAYDIAAISRDEHRNLFPASVMPRRGMAPIDAYWSDDTVNGYFFAAGAPIARVGRDVRRFDALRDAWVDAVTEHPIDYLDHRTTFWIRQLGITTPPAYTFYSGIDRNRFKLVIEHPGAFGTVTDYVRSVQLEGPGSRGSLLYVPAIYLAICVVAAIVLLRRRPATSWMVGAGALAVLLYQTGVYAGTASVNYRFEYPLVAMGTVVVALALGSVLTRRRRAH